MVTVTKERNDDNDIPLSKTFSKEMRDNFGVYSKLDSSYDNISFLASSAGIHSSASTSTLISGIEKLSESIRNTRTSDRLDEIVNLELSERLKIMAARIEIITDKRFDYNKALRAHGIGTGEMKTIEEHFKKIDFLEAGGRWMTVNAKGSEDEASNEEELKIVKNMYKDLVRTSFEMAPSNITSQFKDFDDYMANVKFFEGGYGQAHQHSNIAHLSLSEPKFVKIKSGIRYISIPDMFTAAKVVGSEGLLGRQGQLFNTSGKASQISGFLASASNPMTMVNTEALAKLGSLKMVGELGKEINDLDYEDRRTYESLQERLSVKEETRIMGNFIEMYEEYAYFNNDRNPDAAVKAVSSLINIPDTIPKERISNIETKYGSPRLWKNYEKSVNTAAFIYADIMAKGIYEKLESMSDESREKIRSNISLGYWTRKGFEQYFDYLVEKFG